LQISRLYKTVKKELNGNKTTCAIITKVSMQITEDFSKNEKIIIYIYRVFCKPEGLTS